MTRFGVQQLDESTLLFSGLPRLLRASAQSRQRSGGVVSLNTKFLPPWVQLQELQGQLLEALSEAVARPPVQIQASAVVEVVPQVLLCAVAVVARFVLGEMKAASEA